MKAGDSYMTINIPTFSKNKLIAVGVLLVTVCMFIVTAMSTSAMVNVSMEYTITYNDNTYTYKVGDTVQLTADAVSGGEVFKSFQYDDDLIQYPGISYSNNQFVLTFIMPASNLVITAEYDSDWTVTMDGISASYATGGTTTINEYVTIENGILSEDQSGHNLTFVYNDAVITEYDSTKLIGVTVDNNNTTYYAVGQPVYIKTPYIVNGQVLTGYTSNGTSLHGTQVLYTGTDGVIYSLYKIDGLATDTVITSVYEEGCEVLLKDSQGNNFGDSVIKIGDSITYVVPTTYGDYEISDISAINVNDDAVEVTITKVSDNVTGLTVTGQTSKIIISFTWKETEDTDVDGTSSVAKFPSTTMARQLSDTIKSTGLITIYNTGDLLNPAAQIDADDIQNNRDAIIELQNAVSGTGERDEEDYSNAVYFFHDPTWTDANGQEQSLEGWYMQVGAEFDSLGNPIPDPTNPTWLQVG